MGLNVGGRKKQEDLTITISGRIVTRTIHQSEGSLNSVDRDTGSSAEGRVVDGEVVDAKASQSKVSDILRNVK